MKRDLDTSAGDSKYDPWEAEGVDYMDLPIEVDAPHTNQPRDAKIDKPLTKRQRAIKREELMTKSREDALAIPIGEDNKGFLLLSKFGYSGKGLGKNEEGVQEPVAIQSRDPKMVYGIGVEQLLKDKIKQKEEEMKEARFQREQLSQNFKTSLAQKHEIAKITKELLKNQKIIYNLDTKCGVPPHSLWDARDISPVTDDASVSDVAAECLSM